MPYPSRGRTSQLQRRILRWLALDTQHGRRRCGEGNHADLLRALPHDKSNMSHSLRTLERHGYVIERRQECLRTYR
jgi:DNA-binding IclR family transcriptional regulator